jgi:hypothetical protein
MLFSIAGCIIAGTAREATTSGFFSRAGAEEATSAFGAGGRTTTDAFEIAAAFGDASGGTAGIAAGAAGFLSGTGASICVIVNTEISSDLKRDGAIG